MTSCGKKFTASTTVYSVGIALKRWPMRPLPTTNTGESRRCVRSHAEGRDNRAFAVTRDDWGFPPGAAPRRLRRPTC